MRSRALIAATAALLLAHPGRAAIDAAARIVRVTVHPDRAEVTRSAEVRLPAGASEVRFTDLPEEFDDESLTVSARGVTAVLGTIELREDVREPKPKAEFGAAESEIRRIEAETARLASDEGTDRELRKYLDALRDAASRQQAVPEATLAPNPEALARMLSFLRNGYTEIAGRDVARQAARVALADQLRLAQARREAARPEPSLTVSSAVVGIEASEAGPLRIELTYVVYGASWRPAYRAMLDSGKSAVTLVSEAVVAQATGEDWTDVALNLSTAAPAEGLEPPTLVSWMLVPKQDLSIAGGSAASVGYRVDGIDANNVIDGGLTLQIPSAAIQSFKLITSGASAKYGEQSTAIAEVVSAQMISTGYDISYEVPGRNDVASDSAEHRVTLRSDLLPAKLAYRVIPGLAEAAFAVAETKAPADRPLLAGPVRVIASGTLVGAFDLQETAPGDDLRIPFGADKRVQVTRIPLPQERGPAGAGKDRLVRAAFRTTIENRRDVAVSVTLEERLPVSQDASITVKLGEATTDGSENDEERPGIVTWSFRLEPHETEDVTFEYIVRHPKEMTLAGL